MTTKRGLSTTGSTLRLRHDGSPAPSPASFTSEQRRQSQRYTGTVLDVGESSDLWEEMDWVAAECGLTPTEKAVLSMARLDSYTHREIACELALTPRAVAEILVDALRKAQSRFERAASPRTLFWEEVRQKSRCIYRKRGVGWIR